jgi:hypothetical protein
MATPFSFTGTLNLPGDDGLPADAIPFSLDSQFESLTRAVYKLTGSGTVAVNFGTIPSTGAKGVLVKYDFVAGALPVQISLGGSTPSHEICTGGFLVLFNPTPDDGITSLSIAHTGAGRVRVWLLG